jgi:hypothetical protein
MKLNSRLLGLSMFMTIAVGSTVQAIDLAAAASVAHNVATQAGAGTLGFAAGVAAASYTIWEWNFLMEPYEHDVLPGLDGLGFLASLVGLVCIPCIAAGNEVTAKTSILASSVAIPLTFLAYRYRKEIDQFLNKRVVNNKQSV